MDDCGVRYAAICLIVWSGEPTYIYIYSYLVRVFELFTLLCTIFGWSMMQYMKGREASTRGQTDETDGLGVVGWIVTTVWVCRTGVYARARWCYFCVMIREYWCCMMVFFNTPNNLFIPRYTNMISCVGASFYFAAGLRVGKTVPMAWQNLLALLALLLVKEASPDLLVCICTHSLQRTHVVLWLNDRNTIFLCV